MKRLVVFDLDGTLAESKAALDAEMGTLLAKLLGIVRVAVISGGNWPQFQQQVLTALPQDQRLTNLSLLPTTGTQYYAYTSEWTQLYDEHFTDAEKATIIAALTTAIAAAPPVTGPTWGETIEDRGSQITYSALGQHAPIESKRAWDPDFAKRQRLKAVLDLLLGDFAVNLGGMTSVDITRKGIDKAYGIRKLRDTLHIAIADMLFVGDALFPGGNDHPAEETGVECIQVRDPDESKRVIEAIIACQGTSAGAAADVPSG